MKLCTQLLPRHYSNGVSRRVWGRVWERVSGRVWERVSGRVVVRVWGRVAGRAWDIRDSLKKLFQGEAT